MESGFESLNITRQFIDALSTMGLNEPTDIQRKAIVPAMAGQDVLGIAQTGSGKTLAYLLPLVLKVKYAKEMHPRAVILAPSKELVVQIFRVLEQLTANTDLRLACLYGGVGKKEQVQILEKGIDIVVSTPGRFIDLYSFGHIFTRQIKTMVLDEADRMMEMGFMPQLRQMLEILPVKRQNLLFSATFPERVERLAAEFLEFPTRVESEDKEKPVKEVVQNWYPVLNFRTKLNLLLHLLKDESWSRLIVFCSTKDAAERVSKLLERREAGTVRVLHSNKGQNTRINALDDFKKGDVRILVTTDVTSRGIDVDSVSHVINFELPKVPEDYLHRIGRTARINRAGVAISFVNQLERFYLQKTEQYIGEEISQIPFPESVEQGAFLPGEKQAMAKEIDYFKRKADPDFKGAFHDRKRKAVGNLKRKKQNTRSGKKKS